MATGEDPRTREVAYGGIRGDQVDLLDLSSRARCLWVYEAVCFARKNWSRYPAPSSRHTLVIRKMGRRGAKGCAVNMTRYLAVRHGGPGIDAH